MEVARLVFEKKPWRSLGYLMMKKITAGSSAKDTQTTYMVIDCQGKVPGVIL